MMTAETTTIPQHQAPVRMIHPSELEQQQQQHQLPEQKTMQSIILDLYRGIMDLLFLISLAVVSFFLYDVEIKFINENQQPPRRASPSSNSGLLPRRGILHDSIV
jgi:hypothetical protein